MRAFPPFLALRYLLTRRINLLSVFGVSFAAWAMIVVNSVFTGFVTDIRDDVRRSTPDLLLTDLPHATSYDSLRAALEADPAVAATAPRLRHHGLWQPLQVPSRMQRSLESSQVDFNHMEGGFVLLLGIDPLREPAVTGIRDWIAGGMEPIGKHLGRLGPQGSVFDEADPKRRAEMLVPDELEWRGRGRARIPRASQEEHVSSLPGVLLGWRRAYVWPWLQQGDPGDLLAAAFVDDANGKPQLRTHRVRTAFAGWFATGHRMFDETQAILPIETLRTMLGQDHADPEAIALVTDVAMRLRTGLAPGEIAAAKTRLRTAAQALLAAGSAPCSVLDWEEQNPVFLSAVSHEQTLMRIVLFVVMIVAAFVIYATLHMMVVQKWKDVGILAAIGGTPRGIGTTFLLCGLVVAVVGAILGTTMGGLSVHYLNDFNDWLFRTANVELFPRNLFDLQQVPVRLDPAWLALVACTSVGLALVTAVVPARKAARMNPVKALSYE